MRITDRPFLAPVTARQDFYLAPRFVYDRDRFRGIFLVGRRTHFFPGWQVDPQLKAAHESRGLLRHFRVDYAAGRLHPLCAAGTQVALVAHAVLVQHMSIQHVGQGDEATMRMIRETGNIIIRVITAEMIQHQEGIQVTQGRRADGAMYRYTGTFRHFHRLYDFLYRSQLHFHTSLADKTNQAAL